MIIKERTDFENKANALQLEVTKLLWQMEEVEYQLERETKQRKAQVKQVEEWRSAHAEQVSLV